eukprot:CAMPEP_0201547604 /NCGR_PEP_ID=MMETSP0173_2-20130828/4074_1 /ASSEMBLY_ACC=CAM_ASM_000268 /TAXON_ID=218659 /ORGANISM="Vexillifera sp., Strain DIVA3 564/2" /LENGTH=300 /DNA_ID=CAMNT_0047956707 /DNA_START=145 /DNA_END=1044 /DNA_ORIENTATION=-
MKDSSSSSSTSSSSSSSNTSPLSARSALSAFPSPRTPRFLTKKKATAMQTIDNVELAKAGSQQRSWKEKYNTLRETFENPENAKPGSSPSKKMMNVFTFSGGLSLSGASSTSHKKNKINSSSCSNIYETITPRQSSGDDSAMSAGSSVGGEFSSDSDTPVPDPSSSSSPKKGLRRFASMDGSFKHSRSHKSANTVKPSTKSLFKLGRSRSGSLSTDRSSPLSKSSSSNTQTPSSGLASSLESSPRSADDSQETQSGDDLSSVQVKKPRNQATTILTRSGSRDRSNTYSPSSSSIPIPSFW